MRFRKPSRFPDDDPLKALHVPRRKRLTEDTGDDSDALDKKTGDDGGFDRDAVRAQTEVVDEAALQ